MVAFSFMLEWTMKDKWEKSWFFLIGSSFYVENMPWKLSTKDTKKHVAFFICITHLEIDNDGFVPSNIWPIKNPLQSDNGNLSSNVQVGSQYSFDLSFQTICTFIDSTSIRFDAMEHQIVLPTSVNFIQPVLQIIIDTNQLIHLVFDTLQILKVFHLGEVYIKTRLEILPVYDRDYFF